MPYSSNEINNNIDKIFTRWLENNLSFNTQNIVDEIKEFLSQNSDKFSGENQWTSREKYGYKEFSDYYIYGKVLRFFVNNMVIHKNRQKIY